MKILFIHLEMGMVVYNPLEVLNYKGIDFVCIGEGEEAVLVKI